MPQISISDKLLLAFANTVTLGSGSHGSHANSSSPHRCDRNLLEGFQAPFHRLAKGLLRPFFNSTCHFRFHNSPHLVSILSQTNPVHRPNSRPSQLHVVLQKFPIFWMLTISTTWASLHSSLSFWLLILLDLIIVHKQYKLLRSWEPILPHLTDTSPNFGPYTARSTL
jgi:hypothetical protein